MPPKTPRARTEAEKLAAIEVYRIALQTYRDIQTVDKMLAANGMA
jgi:hypothetical protein